MDQSTLHWLQSPAGQMLLADLAARDLKEQNSLAELTRLRRSYSAEQARAAVEQTLLRKRARAKFPHAERLFFTREALEQSSAAPVAAHRACRLAPGDPVADLGCGIGGDALALAAAGPHVLAVDRDELRLAIASANAAALGFAERISFLQRDLLREPPPPAAAIFCDPGRRAGGQRRFHAEQYEPPLSHVLAWRERTPALAIKLAPGIDIADLPADAEIEFVSLDGELKEAVLWCGPLLQASRRASVLKTGADGQVVTHTLASDVQVSPPSALNSQPAAFLYEPDPAIIRAGLVSDLAIQLDAAQIDSQIAYLTKDRFVATPFTRAWPVLEWLPFGMKALRARLRAHDAGPVTVKKRGSPLDTDTLARQLSGSGPNLLVVVLTRVADRPAALICGPPVGVLYSGLSP